MEKRPEARAPRRWRWIGISGLVVVAAIQSACAADTPVVRPGGTLVYGADEEGGAPYIYVDGASGRRVGFEAELMERVGRELKLRPEFRQAQWEYLLNVLGRGEVDVVINGYELTEARARDYLPTRPYYVYQLQLMARADGRVRSWADFSMPRPGGGPWKVGVLGMSAADDYVARFQGANLRPYVFDSATGAMTAVRNGQIDATLQDLPAARFYRHQPEFRDTLTLAGPPDGCGYYVMYVRKEDVALRDAINDVLGRLIDSGAMRDLCARYDIANDAQDVLKGPVRPDLAMTSDTHATRGPDLDLIRRFGLDLVLAAGVTALLSVTSMPLAIAIGLLVAIGRVYGPRPLALVLRAYVELIRGTPLIIQLFTLFYVLPEFGITLTPWAAGGRRAGPELLGVRGRDLPRGVAGDPTWPDGGGPGAGDDARSGGAAGDRAAGGPDRDPAGHR